jgi:multicomponent Na+:H+ antiporter subunit E
MSIRKHRYITFLWCYGAWCLFNWVPGLQALVIGVPVAWIVTVLIVRLPVGQHTRLYNHPLRIWEFFFHYLPVFAWENIKANIDVALRILHPKMPIKPAIVRVKTVMKTDVGLTVLANSISLVPGTTTVDIDTEKGLLYIHCMAVSEKEVDGVARHVVERFEKILVKIFE